MSSSKSIPLTLLSALYILHGIPIIGFKTPAVVYLLVVVLLYLTLMITVGLEEFFRMLSIAFPVVCLPFLRSLLVLYNGHHSFAIEAYSFLQLLVYPLLGLYILRRDNVYYCRNLLGVIILSYAITCVTTTIGCRLFPNAARALTGGQDDLVMFAQYKLMNIGDFHFVYLIALTLPLLISTIKYQRIKNIIGFPLIALVVVAVYYSAYTTALLFCLMALLLFFVPKSITSRKLVMLTVFSFLVLVAGRLLLSSVLSAFSGSVGNEDVASRLGDMSILFGGGSTEQLSDESDLSSRLDLFLRSLNAFESSPIWGAWGEVPIGGHSYFFDTLGLFGLIGLSLYIWMYTRVYRVFLAPYKHNPWYSFLLFSFILVLFQSILNPNPSMMVVSFIFPIYTCLMDNEVSD